MSAWDRLWPVLLAAGLTFAAAMLVQLYVVPRVERRKRREDRWERDARDLGEHVAFVVQESASAYFNKVHLWWALRQVLEAHVDDPERRERVAGRIREVLDEIRERRSAFRDANQRMEWMTDRVVAINPRDRRLLMLQLWSQDISFQDMTVDPVLHDDGSDLTEEQIDKTSEKVRADIKSIIKRLGELTAGAPPLPPSEAVRFARRMRQRLRSAVRWVFGWRRPPTSKTLPDKPTAEKVAAPGGEARDG